MKQEEPKQETLEEAAERYADYSNDYVPMSFGDKFNETTKTDFIAGAKWQAERMYSEEDLKLAYFSAIESTGEGWNGEYAKGNNPDIEETFGEGFIEWFEQFKKK